MRRWRLSCRIRMRVSFVRTRTLPSAMQKSNGQQKGLLGDEGGEVTLRSLPEDVTNHIASSCSRIDGFAYQVATRRRVTYLVVSSWGRQAIGLVHDPWTHRIVVPRMKFENAPYEILKILPSFKFVTELTLSEQKGDVCLGNVYPPRLRRLWLGFCTVSAGDPDFPKALQCLGLWECVVILGPAGRQWPLLSSSDSAISELHLNGCILQDRANTGGLPLTCPKLSRLKLRSCAFLSQCQKPDLFYGVAPRLREGELTVHSSSRVQNTPRRLGQTEVPALAFCHVAHGFMRNISPQLTSLELALPSHRFVSIASSLSKNLRDLTISCDEDQGGLESSAGACSACERLQTRGVGPSTGGGQLQRPAAKICRCGVQEYPEKLTSLSLSCTKCCLRHMVRGISASGNVAAQLTKLHFLGRGSSYARPSSGRIRMGKFSRLTSLTATNLKVPEALGLLEASQGCRALTSLDISLPWTWNEEIGTRSNAQIQLCLTKLETIQVPLIFSQLNLEGCSALITLAMKDKWDPICSADPGAPSVRAKIMSMLHDAAGSVVVPHVPGRWVAAFRDPLKAEDTHWHPASAPRYRSCSAYPSCGKDMPGLFSITTPRKR